MKTTKTTTKTECYPGAVRCSVCDCRAIRVTDVDGSGTWVVATCARHGGKKS
jgi:hypothetical protein